MDNEFTVRVSFVREFPSDEDHCSALCCFNQQHGCPLDLGDERCVNGTGHYRVTEVLNG